MQCNEFIYRKSSIKSEQPDNRPKSEKETIHSGHFMVSHFEAEAQDDEDDLAVAVPEEEQAPPKLTVIDVTTSPSFRNALSQYPVNKMQEQQLSIETNLSKLFRCMSLAYRQKLTSPKWNRFKGIKLRWKDKIRLNNVIWRCWHMQFIKKRNTFVCQFASPLDVDTHIKPEATLLEGKYWKRRAEAIIAEYKKWRMFHMRAGGRALTAASVMSEMDMVEDFPYDDDSAGHMLVDEDYISFMSDTLFSTITSNQPFAFPDTREIARGAGLADFIQPSLGPLQPNLEDFMDTLEPLQDLLSSAARLPPVPEESAVVSEDIYRVNAVQPNYNTQQYLENYQLSDGQNQYAIQQQHSSNADMIIKEQPHSPIYGGNQLVQSNTFIQQQQQQQNVYGPTQRYMNQSQNQLPMQFTSQSNLIVHQQPQTTAEVMHVQSMNKPIYPSYQIQSGVSTQSQSSNAEVDRYNANLQRSQMTQQPQPSSSFRGRPSRARATSYTNPQQPQSTQVIQTQSVQNPSMVQYNSAYMSPLEGALPTTISTSVTPSAPVKSISPVINVAMSSEVTHRGKIKQFKIPSPPPPLIVHQITPIPHTQQQPLSKDNFRSNSLPLGTQISQLTQDWTVSVQTPVPIQPQKGRTRSRSSGGGHTKPAPPPFTTVLSEPTLPWDSVLLAQLLNSQQAQNAGRSGCGGGAVSGGSSSEDVRPGGGAEAAAPLASPSPPSGPASRTAGSPRSPPSPASPSHAPSRRAGHIHAEQKRRCNIKSGFDALQALIPHLSANPNAKVSKAAMLQKGAEYIKQLKSERNQIKDEIDNLRLQVESLNNSISNCQSLLPATGAPTAGAGAGGGGGARAARLRRAFAAHVRRRTPHDHRYWLFSVLLEPLLASFGAAVASAGASPADARRATLLWLERHCSLVEMRPAVLSALLTLCTKTEILSNPEKLREEALQAIDKKWTNLKNEPS